MADALRDDDDWVTSAMADDTAVADLLTRFRIPKNRTPVSVSTPSLGWTVKQPRSKPAAQRGSPTTPMSWSCATSASGGSEESRCVAKTPQISVAAGSKVNVSGGISSNKRSRKKKTFAQLKEEENLLVNERKQLKRQLEMLRANLENQRAVHENLKRYKIDLQSQTREDKPFAHVSSLISPEEIRKEDCEALKRLPSTLDDSSKNFVLPDLNIPFDEVY